MNAAHVYRTDAGYRAMMAWYDACLAHLTVPCEALTVPTRYGETHLLACGAGDAPPVLLLHGTEGNALSWRYQLPALAARFRVYALDIIGSAGRSAPTRPPYGGAGYAKWLEDVLDALAVPRAAFVGISNGCWLIWKLAAHAPRRISRAVLLSANGLVPVRFPFTLARYHAADLLRTHVASRFLTPALVRRAFQRTLAPGAAVDEEEVEWLYLLLKFYRFVYPPGVLPDATQRLLTAPALLLMGERDLFFDGRAALAQARRTLANLHDAQILPGASHGMILDSPAAVNARMLEFLYDAARSPSPAMVKGTSPPAAGTSPPTPLRARRGESEAVADSAGMRRFNAEDAEVEGEDAERSEAVADSAGGEPAVETAPGGRAAAKSACADSGSVADSAGI